MSSFLKSSGEPPAEEVEAWRHFAAGGSPELLAAARRALREGTPMLHRALRALGGPERVRVALALAKARMRAAEKFSWAEGCLADPQGVEVATPERIARLKARRFARRGQPGGGGQGPGGHGGRQGGTPMLVDLACGIGGDGRELSRVTGRYLGLDLDPLRCLMARHNTGAEVREWDLRRGLPEELVADAGCEGWVFHFDPLRRGGRGRLRGLSGLGPFEALLQDLQRSTRGGALKLGPEVERAEVEELGLGAFSLEYIADAGGLVQAVAWFGELREEGVPLRVTRLLGPARTGEVGELRSFAGVAGQDPGACGSAGGEPTKGEGRWLLLPDPLLDHARLAGACLGDLGLPAAELHPGLGLYRAGRPSPSPWFQSFEILAELPLREKKLKAWLRGHDGGRVVVHTRGKAVTPETWVRKLKGPGKQIYNLFALRTGAQLRALVTLPVSPT